jgi:rhamnose utilization protein RhaD (predicted bifunctional aldolase and dehydrogenase)
MSRVVELVSLARTLGDPAADLAILAEGNVSAREDDESFQVKASGFSMRTIGPEGFVQVRFAPILQAMESGDLTDAQVRECLAEARVQRTSPVLPSVETFMHAFLLGLPDVQVIAHTHPTPLLALLSIGDSAAIASQRLFPDEIVCCGPASCYVPYVDPGLPLANAIRQSVTDFIEKRGEAPKTIWLENHGLIALARNARDAESASFMAVKAARVWLGALSTGQPVRTLTPEQVDRIHTRPDEHYRQRLLWALGRG